MPLNIFSYIVARDYGFAPNPFYGWCTLATCKPQIRARAQIGDWIIGTGAKSRYGFAGKIIYLMQVTEAFDFNTYWRDPRFFSKRPKLNGSLKQLYGDNIYFFRNDRWHQVDSHHSKEKGKPNRKNITHDTNVNRVLVSNKFVYFGENAPKILKRFRMFGPSKEDICCSARGHRKPSSKLLESIIKWIDVSYGWGFKGMPLEFKNAKVFPISEIK